MSFGRGQPPAFNVSGSAFGDVEEGTGNSHTGFVFGAAANENTIGTPMGRGFGRGAPGQTGFGGFGGGGFGGLNEPVPAAVTMPNPYTLNTNNTMISGDNNGSASYNDEYDGYETCDIVLSNRSPIKAVRPLCKVKDSEIAQFAISADYKKIYFVPKSVKRLYYVDIPDDSSPIPTFMKAPRPKLAYPSNNIFGSSFRHEEVFIWVEKDTNQLIVLSRKLLARLSRDHQTFERLGWAPGSAWPMEDSLRLTTAGKVIFLGGSQQLCELVVKGSVASSVPISDAPQIKVYPARFEMAPNGALFCSNANRILRKDTSKGDTEWRPFGGEGKESERNAETRRSGQALSANLTHAPPIACDANSNLLVLNDTNPKSSIPYTALLQYFFQDGSRFETLAVAKDLLPLSRFCSNWSSNIVFHPTLPRFYMSSADYIIAVDFEVPAPPPPLELSRLWHSHPEIADFTIPAHRSMQPIHLHRCILAARWPSLLETLEKSGGSDGILSGLNVSEEIFQIALRYAYDEELPFGAKNISSSLWMRVMQFARAQKMEDLVRRCIAGYQKALWFGAPQECIAGVVAAAEANELELIKIAKSVLSLRPESVRDQVHILSPHTDITTHVLQQFACQLCSEKKPIIDLNESEVPTRIGDDLIRLLDGIQGGPPDMKIQGISCHRAVLVARCPFIELALGSGFKESLSKEIKISDDSISSEAIGRLLRFLYTNEVSPKILSNDPDICDQILRLVDFLQMNAFTELVTYCSGVVDGTKH